MKLLVNPVFLRMGVLFLMACAAFVVGALIMHRLRKNLAEEADFTPHIPLAGEGLPVHAYHAVIQELKQQKHELTAQQLAERRRAKASDTLSATVLAHLSCGVLFLNTSGLVRQANAAARMLLGFASPIGMSAGELFGKARVRVRRDQPATAASVNEALEPALAGRSAVREIVLDYTTPEGDLRALELIASPVLAEDACLLGTALVLTDKTEIQRIRQEEQMRQEISAEMALGLRNSLTTIAGYAQQLAQNKDPELARQLAEEIAGEAARLDRTTVSFLAGAKSAAAGF